MRQDIVVEDAAEANRKALDVLNRGVDSLGFVMTNCKNFTKADMETLLKDICLECVEVNFTLCCNKVAILKMFQEVVSERGIDPEKTYDLYNDNTKHTQSISGRQLSEGFYLNIPQARGSLLLHYQVANDRPQ